jgi:hypothetical protein
LSGAALDGRGSVVADAKLARSTIKACPRDPDEDKKDESDAKNPAR